MFKSDIEVIGNIAKQKSITSKVNPKIFITRGIVAGFYLVVAIILSYISGALVSGYSKDLGGLASAMTFSIALILISFLGGELFTGNSLIMGLGLYSKTIKTMDLIRVFVLSYIGNFIGSVAIGYIFVKSGSKVELLRQYMNPILEAKLNLTASEMFLKGVLCNFIVCISVLATVKLKEESSKMTVMFWCIFAFVVAGFEHSIANMGIFSIGYFIFGELPFGQVLNSMLWVTLGNIVGGMVLYALPLYKMATD